MIGKIAWEDNDDDTVLGVNVDGSCVSCLGVFRRSLRVSSFPTTRLRNISVAARHVHVWNKNQPFFALQNTKPTGVHHGEQGQERQEECQHKERT